ncbi:hypothetical protein [Amycolatopsis sp. WAC 01375]|uniref:hypothetical protein n=1 Tax=Amycolatopsis sp. WAC 01375 TaxID=2203194 RepID=UPI000F7BA1F1|nr:hypothetical protein [Amycolatopsis sp. WAC 01375]
MTEQQPTIPTSWQVQVNDRGTQNAAWVLVSEHEGIGPVAEASRPGAAAEPDQAVADWVAQVLEVTGVVLVPADLPHVWSVEITY